MDYWVYTFEERPRGYIWVGPYQADDPAAAVKLFEDKTDYMSGQLRIVMDEDGELYQVRA